MSIITFWSDEKNQTGQTLATMAVATYMAVEHNTKILLMSTRYNDRALEYAFGNTLAKNSVLKSILKKQDIGIDSGIEGLTKMAASNRLTKDMIPDYTKIVFNKRLEVLYAPKQTDDKDASYEKVLENYKDIISIANGYYDMIFIDLNKGTDDEFANTILKMSDIIVINIEQKIRRIEQVLKLREENPMFKQNNVMILVDRFDKFSKYTSKNITRALGLKKEVFAVPYNTLFFESAEEGAMADFFLRVRKVDQTDKNAIFMNELKRITDGIIYKLQELQMRI